MFGDSCSYLFLIKINTILTHSQATMEETEVETLAAMEVEISEKLRMRKANGCCEFCKFDMGEGA